MRGGTVAARLFYLSPEIRDNVYYMLFIHFLIFSLISYFLIFPNLVIVKTFFCFVFRVKLLFLLSIFILKITAFSFYIFIFPGYLNIILLNGHYPTVYLLPVRR